MKKAFSSDIIKKKKRFRIWLSKRGQVKICRNVRFTDQHNEFNSNEEWESESNTIIIEHQKDDTTKINVELKIIIQLINNEQINSDEEPDDPKKKELIRTRSMFKRQK